MTDGREASGFRCPRCGEEQANVMDIDLPQVELECQFCGLRWSVEP